MTACFLTGPVAMKDQVRAAFCAPTVPHRDPAFLASIGEVRGSLASLVNAAHAVLLVGSGTLANDAVAAQIRDFDGEGLVLANGEFGERLIDHARRWDLRFDALRRPWGQAFDWNHARRVAERLRPSWIWAVLTETSTGVLNPLAELRALSTQTGAHLCLDAVSAIGLVPVDLAGVRLATAVSGKGLAAYPGLAAVFHDGRLEHARRTPRYLDLAEYERMDGVPFTHSSNLVSALHCALRVTDWRAKFARAALLSDSLRMGLRHHGLAPLAADEHAAPGILTIPLPGTVIASEVATRLSAEGIDLACQSGYLRERNWLQISLMGEIEESAAHRLPALLARATGVRRHAPPANPRAAGRSSGMPLDHRAR